jgi:hypothetical protein
MSWRSEEAAKDLREAAASLTWRVGNGEEAATARMEENVSGETAATRRRAR